MGAKAEACRVDAIAVAQKLEETLPEDIGLPGNLEGGIQEKGEKLM